MEVSFYFFINNYVLRSKLTYSFSAFLISKRYSVQRKHWFALKRSKKMCTSQKEHFNSLRSVVTLWRLRKGTDVSDFKKVILNL